MAKTTRRRKHSRYNERALKVVLGFVGALVALNLILPEANSMAYNGNSIPSEEPKPITVVRLGYHTKTEKTNYQTSPEWVLLSAPQEESTVQPEPIPTVTVMPEWRYKPTEEERWYTYKLAFAEAGAEDPIGQTAVAEVGINSVEYGWADNLIEEFQRPGRYSSVIDGIPQVPAYGGGYRPVTEDDLSEELKEAVDRAFLGERVTEQLLRAQAESQGLTDEAYWKGGALYFFNWNAIGPKAKEDRNQTRMPVRVEIGNHTFARYWK